VLYTSDVPAQPAVIVYTVQSGDTLSGIAQRYHESLGLLEYGNRKTCPDPNVIYPGERLTVRPGDMTEAVRALPSDAPRATADDVSVSASAGQEIADMNDRGMFGENLMGLGQFLVAHGYSPAAAAGIAACVAGESSGDPEAVGDGGGGLIGWTPLPPGFITGDTGRDFAVQMSQVVEYNLRQNPGSIPVLNAIRDPVDAADFYSQNFERPAVADSDVVASVAIAVYDGLRG
jgi:hypothetical protein